MLINKIFKQLILYISLFCSFNTFAVVNSTHVYHINWITLTGAADASQFMKNIYAGGRSTTTICSDKSTSYTLGRIEFTPTASYVLSYQPTSAHTVQNLFDMHFLGLGSSPNYLATFFNQTGAMENTVNGVQRSIGKDKQILWLGSAADDGRGFIWGYLTYILKSADQIQPGIYQVPETSAYYIDCYDTAGTLQQRHEFKSSTFQITSQVTSCTPAETTKIINMAGIPLATLENAAVGSLLGTKQQSFSLTCDPNINVYLSVNDLLTPSNVGGIASSIESNGATGVGYAVTSSANPNGMTLSAPGSTPGSPNVHQYRLGNSGTAATNLMDYTLGFSYIKTAEEVTEGKANAIIGITYSYQ